VSNLVLAPTYSVALALSGVSGALTIDAGADSLALVLQPALRGEAGYGLLGTAEATLGAAIDISQAVGVFTLALTGNAALSFTGGTLALNRKRFLLEVTQGGVGSFTLTPDATVGLGPDLPTIDLSTDPGVTDALGFIYRHETGKCHFLGINHGST
jgi:hypothetical protein